MFKNIKLNPIYSSYENNIAEEFYNPILKQSVKFDRISAYFSAKSLAYYADGLELFARNGCKYRLIISSNISAEDYEYIKRGYKLRDSIKKNMLEQLRKKISLYEQKNISNLAYLIALEVVEIKLAFTKSGIFHDKCGIFWDCDDNVICFRGSNNETEAALGKNYETFIVTCSWLLDDTGFYKEIITKSIDEFNRLWDNKYNGVIVLNADEVIMNEILKHNKNEIIVEEILLKSNCIILDYCNNQLILRINMDDDLWITGSAFFKIKLKRYVEKIENKKILFKNQLTYIDYEKINKLIELKAKTVEKQYYVTNRLLEYIEERNYYINKRAKVGIDIKNKDERFKNKFEQYKKIVNKELNRKLRDKQMWDSFFMFAMNKCGNFSVPGSGKTSSVLGMYAFLKANNIVKRIVMIGPKNSFGSWIDEFNICFSGKEELKLFNIHDKRYRGINDKKSALSFDVGNCNLLLFNYESIGTYIEEIEQLVSSETILVFDEVHKIKKIDGIFSKNALQIAKKAYYTIVMTGTPIPNSYVDIYNFLHILYNDEYKEFFNFDLQVLKNPSESEKKLINKKIQPFFCRTTKKELGVPEINEDIILAVDTNKKEQKLFEILVNKYRKNKLALFIRLLQLESNPKLLLQSLDLSYFSKVLEVKDSIDDIDYVDYTNEVSNIINSITITSKMKNCINQIKNIVQQKKKLIVWCIFKDSINNIHKNLSDIGIISHCIFGEIELENRTKIINDFKDGKFDVLITNPHTLAESVSLHTICHDAIYFEYSYNLVHLLQSKDRIHRLGLQENQYTQYYFMQDIFQYDGKFYSIDEQVYNRLKDKEQVMIKAIENRKIETVTTSDEDLEFILSKLFGNK